LSRSIAGAVMAFTMLNLCAFTQALALATIGGASRRLFVLKIYRIGQYAKLVWNP